MTDEEEYCEVCVKYSRLFTPDLAFFSEDDSALWKGSNSFSSNPSWGPHQTEGREL